jgi:mannose-6-phosphate isomerase-like protein (cupin superfamily)/pyrroloquinoline quinone (PQQ) biosynthesis protein C
MTPLEQLEKIQIDHPLWRNPLLLAAEQGKLSRADFKFIFSQYYLYSKNFSRLIAIAMAKCESDYFRSKLSENLWEEGGGLEIEKRHSEIFRQFLKNSLNVDPSQIIFSNYTQSFFKDYFALCERGDMAETAAVLSFGTEGIVSNLYRIFKKGLLSAGLSEEELHFFNLHIECDDDHALTLQELALSFEQDSNFLEKCSEATKAALSLRDQFFKELYQALEFNKLEPLINIVSRAHDSNLTKEEVYQCHFTLNNVQNKLYSNVDRDRNINFNVDRVPFPASVMDPRIVHIPPSFNNELHRHAHETIFYFLSGSGEVYLDEHTIQVKTGDLVYVPRWSIHQTKNTGSMDMIVLAITDYGLTGRFSSNSASTFRMKK